MFRKRGFEIVKDEYRKFPDNEIILPRRSTDRAMAYDFFSNARYTVQPNQVVKIWTDVKAYMGRTEGLILNVRSSMGGKFMLANSQGWIDSDYYSNINNDGNIGIFLKNISNTPITIEANERIAQGMFQRFLISDNENCRKKRTGGFGSTGK